MFQRSYLSNSPYKLVFHEDDDELNEINKDNDKDSYKDKLLTDKCDDYENEIYNLTDNLIENNKFDSLQQYNRRKRRQLPKIPENKKPFSKLIGNGDSNQNKLIRQISNTLSLQIELNDQKIPISLKLINKDNEKKNDEKDELSVNSIDYRPLSEQLNIANEINSIQSLNNNSINKLNQNKIEGNYRGLHRFIARHDDEISIDIGDEIFVIDQEDNLVWMKGINLANNQTGFFPSLYAYKDDELFQTKTVNYFGLSDDDSGLNCDDFDSTDWLDIGKQRYQIQKERFCLKFLGSLEVKKSKGKEILTECIKKIIKVSKNKDKNQLKSFVCVIEITDCGIRFFNQEEQEKKYKNQNDNLDENNNLIEDNNNYFFHLNNITYCDYLEIENKLNNNNNNNDNNDNYFAFITQHPKLKNKYASHCFISDNLNVSKYICESIANAFRRYYQNYIELSQNYSKD